MAKTGPRYLELLLDCAEELSRCATASIAGVQSILAGESRIRELRRLVLQARKPYHLEGGKKIREGGDNR